MQHPEPRKKTERWMSFDKAANFVLIPNHSCLGLACLISPSVLRPCSWYRLEGYLMLFAKCSVNTVEKYQNFPFTPTFSEDIFVMNYETWPWNMTFFIQTIRDIDVSSQDSRSRIFKKNGSWHMSCYFCKDEFRVSFFEDTSSSGQLAPITRYS